jgi:hypothetical protein
VAEAFLSAIGGAKTFGSGSPRRRVSTCIP